MRSQNCTHTVQPPAVVVSPEQRAKNFWESPTRILVSLFEALVVWQGRVNSRRHLADMDARLLRDMGISRDDADREAGKSFWRA